MLIIHHESLHLGRMIDDGAKCPHHLGSPVRLRPGTGNYKGMKDKKGAQ